MQSQMNNQQRQINELSVRLQSAESRLSKQEEKLRNELLQSSGYCYLNGARYSTGTVLYGRICQNQSGSASCRFTAVAKHQGGLTALFFTHRKHTITMFPSHYRKPYSMGLQRHRTVCRCILPAFSTQPTTQKEAAKCAAGAGAHKDVAGFPQKINYLRKIDPFVFEELLLEGFEAHGFRTIRNKRYTAMEALTAR